MANSTVTVYVFRDGRYEVVPGDVVHIRWNRRDRPEWQARVDIDDDDLSEDDLRIRAYELIRARGYHAPRPVTKPRA